MRFEMFGKIWCDQKVMSYHKQAENIWSVYKLPVGSDNFIIVFIADRIWSVLIVLVYCLSHVVQK